MIVFGCWYACALLFNFTDTMAGFWISIVMIGIGIGGSANFTTSLPASVFGRKGFDKVNSVLFPIQGIITALTFAINGAVMNMTGGNIRYAYAIDACLALINVIVIIAFVKDHKYNADWIAEHYRKKDVRFFITNGFKIIPIRRFRECFEISATYRVKRSGSSGVGKKQISVVKDFLFKQDYEIRNVQTEGNKLFITSNLPYHDQRFILNEYEYMFSQRGERYEIRKLSNTYNANVIFSVKLNEYASGLTDQEFITALI